MHDQVALDKSRFGWELEELEQAAHLVAAEDTEDEEEGTESCCEQDVSSNTSGDVSLEKSIEHSQSVELGEDHDGECSVNTELSIQEHPQQMTNGAVSTATGSGNSVCEDDITKLTHGLESLLTLNSPTHDHSTAKQRLIEEL